jgi:2,3-bisphosphoglycerate-independent phosphoglycerate mutase
MRLFVTSPAWAEYLQAEFTAGLVNELSSEIFKVLSSHPINHQRKAQVSKLIR